ncbi:hypothetical protein MKW94_017435 [Papaver nudicaule]|uniref:NAD-dependent epimerase/dehydratase domain-containing protein n=1 Tax=Papaver nudicaule TaxID=74823 RepID=A0AA41VDD6_PAPNU|nr:hypothetical protein [Papaver nudicaule]
MERVNKGAVCVTGGAGYFASWLIKSLLERGYTVRTTVRSDYRQVSHLKSLPEASGNKLQVFIADLERPESFAAVIDGCIGVFHVAHPIIDFTRKTEEPHDKMINTSIEGGIGVLKACLRTKTVKKVIYTSSAAAAVFISNKKDVEEINEKMWSDIDTLQKTGKWYPLSKTLTERAMFEFAEQHGFELVSVVPSMIVGQFLSSSLPFSLKISQALVLGTREQYNLLSTLKNAVHIDDAASAHIFLFECPNATGRYICSSSDITIHDIAKFVSTKYPDLQLPTG